MLSFYEPDSIGPIVRFRGRGSKEEWTFIYGACQQKPDKFEQDLIPFAKVLLGFTLLFDFSNHLSGVLLSPELSLLYCGFATISEAAATCILEAEDSSPDVGDIGRWSRDTDSAAGFRRGCVGFWGVSFITEFIPTSRCCCHEHVEYVLISYEENFEAKLRYWSIVDVE
jgi:hypothetical protein